MSHTVRFSIWANDSLENAAAQNARWYPIPANYNYMQPMYVNLPPFRSDYVAMGGMSA